VEHIADAGFDTIDIWSGRPHAYRRDYSEKQLTLIAQRIKELDLDVSSFLPAFYRYPYSLSSPNDIVRTDSIRYMQECMDNAVALESPILLIVPERSLEDQEVNDAYERLIDSIIQICEYAEQYPIRLGLEAVNHFVSDMVRTAREAMQVIELIDHEKLGVVIDTGHIHLSGESIADAVRIPGERLLQVHVNDNDGEHQQNLVPGAGTFPFDRLITELREVGYSGVLTAELGYHYTFDPDPAVALAQKCMHDYMEQP
jgi:sugar phosphate isomerase/epimerase